MKKIKTSAPAKSAVYLGHLGINTVVLAEHSKLELVRLVFEDKAGTFWTKEADKASYLAALKEKVEGDDKFFDAHVHLANKNNKRWMKFMDACVCYAILDAQVKGMGIPLLHPDSFSGINNASPNAIFKAKPTFIPGIPTLM